MNTDSNSLYYKLRVQGYSDQEARDEVLESESICQAESNTESQMFEVQQ